MESLSGTKALLLSLSTGGPAVLVATANSDFLPVATGAAVGVLFFLFAIWGKAADQRLSASECRLADAEKTADEYRAAWIKAKNEAADLKASIDAPDPGL